MSRSSASAYSTNSCPTTKTEIISAESNTVRIIRKATFTNNSGSTQTVDLYIDPSGSLESRIVNTKVLIDKETWSCPDIEGHVLSAAGTIDVTASAANVALTISEVKDTG